MRINVYAEELPELDGREVEVVSTTTASGRTFFGARIYLKSPEELHDRPGDDDRSAITVWGPRLKVADLLLKLSQLLYESEYREQPAVSPAAAPLIARVGRVEEGPDGVRYVR